jgi:PPP family 3-phenylpropionic acid transporter
MAAIRTVYLVLGAALGVFYPFMGVILQSRGFSPTEIGFVQSGAALAFTVAVPIWGHLADVVLGRSRALAISAAGSAAALGGFMVPGLAGGYLAASLVGYLAFESAMAPLADALAVNALADQPRRYARARLLSSLGFAACSILAGVAYQAAGYGPAPFVYAAAALVIVAISRFVPDVPRLAPVHLGAPESAVSSGASIARSTGARPAPARSARSRPRTPGMGAFGLALRLQPRLGGLLLALVMVHVGMLAGFTFLALRLVDLGGGASAVALSAGLSALAEIPGMAIAPWLVGRVGLRATMAAGMLLYAACMAAWAVLASPELIITTRFASGIAFAWITVAAVLTIGQLLPDRLQATGQGLYQTVGFGVASVVANAAGGLVFGSGGALVLFSGCAALAAGGAVVAWRVAPARGEAVERPLLPEGTGEAG